MEKPVVYIGVCPECSSINAVPIFRGYPSPEIREQVKRGRAVWGGCRLADEKEGPNWMCRECGHHWFEE